jgi:hypothetical protein
VAAGPRARRRALAGALCPGTCCGRVPACGPLGWRAPAGRRRPAALLLRRSGYWGRGPARAVATCSARARAAAGRQAGAARGGRPFARPPSFAQERCQSTD